MKYRTALALAFFLTGFALGVPLLGWGITDWEGFFSSPVRLLYGFSVGLLSLVCAISYLLLPFSYTPGKREGEKSKRIVRQSVVPLVTRLVWLAILVISPYSDRHNWAVIEDATWLRHVGVLVYALGLAWVGWAFLTLGKQHSGEVTIQKEHEPITGGPYRWLRHPMYLGLIAFPAGVGLVFGSWIGAALPLLLVGVFVWRIGDEEQLMRQEFGERWDTYCQHTWRLVPYIY
jgi:protein-S-isoprenylcysteine O-methyltransferase Ste14